MTPKMRMWTGNHMIYMDLGRNIESITSCYAQQVLFDALNDVDAPMLYPAYDHVGKHGAAFELATGLRDKKGIEIYAGDILRSEEGLHIVLYEMGRYIARRSGVAHKIWDSTEDSRHFHQTKVVGNIHEHPGLLSTTVDDSGEGMG